MDEGDTGLPPDAPREPGRSTRVRGRPPVHGLKPLRRAVTALTTRRLDGRSAVAIAVRKWKEDVRQDLGGDLSRAQETVLELAAQSWVIVLPSTAECAASWQRKHPGKSVWPRLFL